MGMCSGEEEKTPMQVVQDVFQAWGSGAYAGKGGQKLMAKHFSADMVMDCTLEMKNSDKYKVYEGFPGVTEWLEFLATQEFPDFNIDEMKEGDEEGVVLCTASFTPYNPATMKKCSTKCIDKQVWTVKEGKVTNFKIGIEQVAEVDAMFVMTPAEQAVGTIMMNWGTGKYSGETAQESMDATVTDDYVGDSSGGGVEWKNTEGYKVYEGKEGWAGWIEFLTTLDFPDFKVLDSQEQEDGTVKMTMCSTTVCKATKKSTEPLTSVCTWTITDGKCSKASFEWGDAAALDAIFAA